MTQTCVLTSIFFLGLNYSIEFPLCRITLYDSGKHPYFLPQNARMNCSFFFVKKNLTNKMEIADIWPLNISQSFNTHTVYMFTTMSYSRQQMKSVQLTLLGQREIVQSNSWKKLQLFLPAALQEQTHVSAVMCPCSALQQKIHHWKLRMSIKKHNIDTYKKQD